MFWIENFSIYLKKKKKKTLKEEKSQPRDIVAIWHHP